MPKPRTPSTLAEATALLNAASEHLRPIRDVDAETVPGDIMVLVAVLKLVDQLVLEANARVVSFLAQQAAAPRKLALARRGTKDAKALERFVLDARSKFPRLGRRALATRARRLDQRFEYVTDEDIRRVLAAEKRAKGGRSAKALDPLLMARILEVRERHHRTAAEAATRGRKARPG